MLRLANAFGAVIVPTACPFCSVAAFPTHEEARDHVLVTHPDQVEARLAQIPARTREHMVNPSAWAAGALLYE